MSASISGKTAAELERLLSRREKKAKASVSLSREIIRAADAVAGKARRSALVERAMRSYLRSLVRRARNEHDLQAINARAQVTNRESDRLLDLQAWPQ
jgi:metal-responsive CopG/Arc/MetJ family transcriptional regulator